MEKLSRAGIAAADLAERVRALHTERNRSIRNVDFRRLDPASVADDYLLPRKDLHRFVVEAWIRHIFLPSLSERVRGSILLFGLGRLFSAHNDLGVQHSTDVDLNAIARDDLPARDFSALAAALARLRLDLHDGFGIVLELHPDFSLLRESKVLARLDSAVKSERIAAFLFYKAHERGIRILQDEAGIRERIFSRVRGLPDACLFEYFLGIRGSRNAFCRVRSGEPLGIGQDACGPAAQVRTVIGSRSYDLWCRRLFPARLMVSPPEWHFSMKHFVNRVYDYACAMRGLGYSLRDIGFTGRSGPGGADPDWLYLRNAHKLMLHLRELTQNTLGSYAADVDSSYISRARFLRFVEVCGDRFRADFSGLMLEGGLIPPSQVPRYKALQAKIRGRARDRFMEGPRHDLAAFPPGFRYESTFKDAHSYRICVPYSWADLGYYSLATIAERVARIVECRLLPLLPRLGMHPQDMEAYAQALDNKPSSVDF